jgi:two-component system cell cycle sensor histidine kinase/response regulator CckA
VLIIAKLASDLRVLLTVIVNCVESLRALVPADRTTEQIFAELDGAVDSAFYISREFLALSEPRGERGVIDANELVAQARGVLERVLGQDIRLSIGLADAPPIVQADPVELEWVLLNLAANGRDAMPDGGVLTIETSSIEAWLQYSDASIPRPRRYLRLTVSDTGRGMTPEAQMRGIEPFFTTREGATGLGLTSVAITVRSLKGWLHVQANEPYGTRVHVYLPMLSGTRR